MLSPEKYIRQKARSLPVYDCWINKHWKESQMANIVVARQHTNGNITAGIYLMDLSCLGVKDTLWVFNLPLVEFRDKLEIIFDAEGGFSSIEYALAHNIVYAGIEFAADYEFKPHKDFTSLTQYILEEDTNAIPLIEVTCGFDGFPAYMQESPENNHQSKEIIAQLERVAGPGNYMLLDEYGNNLNDVDYFDDEEEEDEFTDMDFEEKRNEFLNYYQRIETFSESEAKYFFSLQQSIVNDSIDHKECNRYYDDLLYEVTKIEIDYDEIPAEMFGLESADSPIEPEVKALFWEIIDQGENLKVMKKRFKQFLKFQGYNAAKEYLGLLIGKEGRSKKYEEELKLAASKYPNYALIQLKLNKLRIISHNFESELAYPYLINQYFKGRKSIHPWEQFCYIDLLTHYVLAEKNFGKLEAMKDVLLELSDDNESYTILYSLCLMFQIEIMANKFRTPNI
ncbi:MAG: hypothetical protein ACERKD_16330 [Prolixibacteraceae bacterium]